ncbi:NEQ146 [Nanoarchaeum equitans Kin4-M]|uniref:Large ribosomal subunit protein uL4 n=1 Tax=Nanoarchaeum equitans (strain Kin4-M) TaxID=228908 RepID=RL4_NANEQ|nr:RecName: Full=Large ribosomal subunit protein uL4; AltName: Full=50S ribosomal protein L4 [Nanoarchaeum equitans Kin4-M]AAR39000.1 NEQ146 [Nanoarchaeum equitans Kin4-M]
MEVPLYNLQASQVGNIELPPQFNEKIRFDVIKRAFLAIQSHKRQPYGASPIAGKQHSAWTSKRRRSWRTSYGRGISRVSRAILRRHGALFYWVARNIAQAVKGKKAHPPKAEKDWYEKINKKERRLAIRSALAATKELDLVKARGHIIDKPVPIVVDGLEQLRKTKEIQQLLLKLGLEKELERVYEIKRRAGKGKRRGRAYIERKGPLIVVNDYNEQLFKAVDNIPGLDIEEVPNLNVELLAPGAKPGRLLIISKDALETLRERKLFF